MSSKSSKYYNEEKEIHVYYDLADNQYYLECPSPEKDHVDRTTKLLITKEVADAFLNLERIEKGEICPHCHRELKKYWRKQ